MRQLVEQVLHLVRIHDGAGYNERRKAEGQHRSTCEKVSRKRQRDIHPLHLALDFISWHNDCVREGGKGGYRYVGGSGIEEVSNSRQERNRPRTTSKGAVGSSPKLPQSWRKEAKDASAVIVQDQKRRNTRRT
jgi:hypothetical protein